MAAMDVLLLAELVFSIYMAVQDMSTVSATFCTYFVPMGAVTVAGARWALKHLAPPISSDEFAPVGIMGPFKGRVIPR
jgi:hypothetical protein